MGNSSSKPSSSGGGSSGTTSTQPPLKNITHHSSTGSSTLKNTRPQLEEHLSTHSAELPSLTRSDSRHTIKSTRSLRSRSSHTSLSALGDDKSYFDRDETAQVNNDNNRLDLEDPIVDRSNFLSLPDGSSRSIHSSLGGKHSPRTLHQRHHSMGNIPTLPNEKSLGQMRRSSFNTNSDVPPSMVKMEPKTPILQNNLYSSPSNSNSIPYYENALTDDDGDSDDHHYHNNSNKTSRDNITAVDDERIGSSTPTLSSKSRSKNSRRSSRNSSRSGSFSSSKGSRKKSFENLNDTHLGTPPLMSRSNSHSSSHSRKSSFGSTSNTAFNTPMHSPSILNTSSTSIDKNNDYFNVDKSNATNMLLDNGNENNNSYNSSSDDKIISTELNHLSIEDNTNYQLNSLETQNSNIDDPNVPKKKKPLKPIDIDLTIQKLLDAGYASKRTKNVCLKNSEIAQICHAVRDIFLSQPSLLELSSPVKIVGDVHGQYADLLRLFTKCGFPPSSNYLFLGDYVDRGKQSLETILLLFCYKIKYPENFFLLRGNHECANVTRVYGFYDECKRRCNIKTWKVFIDTFNTLPLAAIVAGKIFCVHGGLSPVLNSMDEIRHVSRPTDVPDFGLINDLLWSDPTDSPNEWEDNERGVSYCYNKVAINKFLNRFGFDLVCRAHMVVEDGYEFFNDRSLVTVFSAPNYCGEFDNWGAVMSVSEGLLCSFELLDPLDSAALKQVMKKGRQERKLANKPA